MMSAERGGRISAGLDPIVLTYLISHLVYGCGIYADGLCHAPKLRQVESRDDLLLQLYCSYITNNEGYSGILVEPE